jgi:hypothetical protein
MIFHQYTTSEATKAWFAIDALVHVEYRTGGSSGNGLALMLNSGKEVLITDPNEIEKFAELLEVLEIKLLQVAYKARWRALALVAEVPTGREIPTQDPCGRSFPPR